MLYVAFTVLSLCHAPSVTLAMVLKWVVRNRLDSESLYWNPSHPSIPLQLYRLSFPILLIIDKTLSQVSPQESAISNIWRSINWSESFIMVQVSQHENDKVQLNFLIHHYRYKNTCNESTSISQRQFRQQHVYAQHVLSVLCVYMWTLRKLVTEQGPKCIECLYDFKQKHRISEIQQLSP